MPRTKGSPSQHDAGLTRERIVDHAIQLLDAGGTRGLTFRNLALELETGHGAIQWHVTNKGELMTAATVTAMTRALPASQPGTSPQEAIRGVALGVFDAIDSHPWLGQQLFAVPSQPAMVRLWEQIGRPLEELGLTQHLLFTAVSTLVSYVVGAGSQNALNARMVPEPGDRRSLLDRVAAAWESVGDDGEDSFMRRVTDYLRAHDDRQEFLAGLDIILKGLAS